jgi:hypothetical protein
VRRATLPALVIVVGLLLLADFLIVNASLGELASVAVDAAILVASGAALAAVVALLMRRSSDLWRRRGDPVGAVLVVVGIAVILVAGLRPGSDGVSDPAVAWLVAALMVPIAATLFGLLFVTTLTAVVRAVAAPGGGREALVVAAAAGVVLVLLLPIGGAAGDGLAAAAEWTLALPVGSVFRGIIIGVGIAAAVAAARTLLGVGSTDD